MKDLDSDYYVEVKDHRYQNHLMKILVDENEILQYLSVLNIKYRITLRFGKIKKLLKTMEN